jgi:hypothetical protein
MQSPKTWLRSGVIASILILCLAPARAEAEAVDPAPLHEVAGLGEG